MWTRYPSECPTCGNIDMVTERETTDLVYCQVCYERYVYGENKEQEEERIETKFFTRTEPLSLGSVFEYQDFIASNQDIEIISINVLQRNTILLTYKTKGSDN